MKPKIVNISNKKVVGMRSTMYHNAYGNIVALWKCFMPRKKDLKNVVNDELIAMQVYSDFDRPENLFEIWACTEVSNFENIPESMESFTIPNGAYAVFLQKGMDASVTYQRIMTEWLPTSGYHIDDRPHFQVMGEKYENGSSDSEEDFYVPIRKVFL